MPILVDPIKVHWLKNLQIIATTATYVDINCHFFNFWLDYKFDWLTNTYEKNVKKGSYYNSTNYDGNAVDQKLYQYFIKVFHDRNIYTHTSMLIT